MNVVTPCTDDGSSEMYFARFLGHDAAMHERRRRLATTLATIAVAGAVGIPVIASAAQPSEPPGQTKPEKSPKGPKVDATVRGKLVAGTDDKGRPTFTITASGRTWEISAGPKWFFGDDSPLKAYVGKTVTVVGTHREGDTDLSADTINGKELRAAGKPPWAGGPRAVGERHPGWKGWKGDKPGKGIGRDAAAGQQKKASPAP